MAKQKDGLDEVRILFGASKVRPERGMVTIYNGDDDDELIRFRIHSGRERAGRVTLQLTKKQTAEVIERLSKALGAEL